MLLPMTVNIFLIFPILLLPLALTFSVSGVWDDAVSLLGFKRSVPSNDIPNQSCSVRDISGLNNFDVQRFSGDWYEIAKTATSVPFFKSSIWRFQPIESTRNLAFFFSARVESGNCLNPFAGEVIASTTNPGTLILSYDGLKGRVEEELKVIFTDYNNITVFYACRHVMPDTGSCHPDGVFVSALSRQRTLKDSNIFHVISDSMKSICFDTHRFIPQDANKSCNLDELDVRDYKETISDNDWPVCKHAAVCTLACPPCCHQNENGCIVCDCKNVRKGDENTVCTSDKCSLKQTSCQDDVSNCPSDCHVVESIPGCKKCICTDIGNVAPFAAPPKLSKDFYNISSIHSCPTTCRTEKHAGILYCNCENQLICKLPKEEGNCKGNIERYYFNGRDESCHAFVYGGCGGNSNNFKNIMECFATCKDVCDLPLDVGTENEEYQERYYFNRVTETCSTFHYKGKGGNENNFVNINDCKLRCPERTFQKNPEILAVCNLIPMEGTCKYSTIHYYFDPTSRTCVPFFYSGCGGNRNRFYSKTDCQSLCLDAAPKNPCFTECTDPNCVMKADCQCECGSASINLSLACLILSGVLLLLRR